MTAARRPRALHCGVAACAGHQPGTCGEGESFTVTTPLYYVNAGEGEGGAPQCGAWAAGLGCHSTAGAAALAEALLWGVCAC